MPLNCKLDLKNFREKIFFTDGHISREGFLYHKDSKCELLFYESENCIGSFTIHDGDLIIIYSGEYLLKKNNPHFYKKGKSYQERKVSLEQTAEEYKCLKILKNIYPNC